MIGHVILWRHAQQNTVLHLALLGKSCFNGVSTVGSLSNPNQPKIKPHGERLTLEEQRSLRRISLPFCSNLHFRADCCPLSCDMCNYCREHVKPKRQLMSWTQNLHPHLSTCHVCSEWWCNSRWPEAHSQKDHCAWGGPRRSMRPGQMWDLKIKSSRPRVQERLSSISFDLKMGRTGWWTTWMARRSTCTERLISLTVHLKPFMRRHIGGETNEI